MFCPIWQVVYFCGKVFCRGAAFRGCLSALNCSFLGDCVPTPIGGGFAQLYTPRGLRPQTPRRGYNPLQPPSLFTLHYSLFTIHFSLFTLGRWAGYDECMSCRQTTTSNVTLLAAETTHPCGMRVYILAEKLSLRGKKNERSNGGKKYGCSPCGHGGCGHREYGFGGCGL